MSRLIDADLLEPDADYDDGEYWAYSRTQIENAPTIEPERKGTWVWNENGMDWGLGAWVCSVCRSKPETWWESAKQINPLRCSGSHFCGNCGADMREGEQS